MSITYQTICVGTGCNSLDVQRTHLDPKQVKFHSCHGLPRPQTAANGHPNLLGISGISRPGPQTAYALVYSASRPV